MNFFTCATGRRRLLWKALIMTKMVTFLLLTFFLQEGLAAKAQQITIVKNNTSLKKILFEVRRQSGYDFVFDDASLDAASKVSVNFRNLSLDEALKKLFKNQPFSYIVSNKTIVIVGKSKESSNASYLELLQQLISGKVSDDKGQPLAGVSVRLKGKTEGTVTDENGQFTIRAEQGDVLLFTYIGFVPQEITYTSQNAINVTMKPDVMAMSEIVVVGYGTQKRGDVTGAVSTVNVEKATSVPTTNISEMIRGQAAGVSVSLGSARPGGSSNILIRGTRSITGNNEPLVVLDGFPIENINDVNPEDIASVEILKDAASQAIYGARASNGVILITTKRGKTGKISVNASTYYTAQKLTKNFDLYNAEEFAQFRREAKRTSNGGEYLANDADNFGGATAPEFLNYQAGNFADWEDAVLRTGGISSSTVSISGGNENTKLFSSLNYFDQKGLIPSSGYKRGSFRINLGQKISEKASIEANVNLSSDFRKQETTGLDFITISPFTGPYDLDGNLVDNVAGVNASSSTINPLWSIREATNDYKTNFYNINFVGNYQFTKSFSYKLNTLYSNRTIEEGLYRTRLHREALSPISGKANVGDRQRKEYLIENIFNYNVDINPDNRLEVTAVQSLNEINNMYTITEGTNFPNDILGYNGISSALNFKTNRTEDRRRLVSFMGRVRYNLFDKYLFTLTARQDGASVFSTYDKWAFFPAAAFAWKAHEESFLKNVQAIDELKLRLSYGAVGNQALSPYQTLGLVDVYNYVFGGNLYGGSLPGNLLPNPNITWETSTTFNTGLDFALLGNKLSGSVDYYVTNTTDLLLPVPINSLTGFTSTIANLGASRNSGIELLLSYQILRNRDFSWKVSTTFAKNKNEIIKSGLTNPDGSPRDDENNNRFIGYPINIIYSYTFDGIFQTDEEAKASPQANTQGFQDAKTLTAGAIRLKDLNGDGQITDADKSKIRTQPDWFGSASTTFSYKGFDLLADVYYVKGATKRNPYLSDFNQGGTFQSVRNGIKVDYWTPEHPSNAYPRPNFDSAPANLGVLNIVDASYFRLRTLSLGYNIPKTVLSHVPFNNLRVYFTGTNLLTATKYKSYNPENNPGDFPDAKSYTFGLSIGL